MAGIARMHKFKALANRRNAGPRAPSSLTANDDVAFQGNPVDQGRIVEVDQRSSQATHVSSDARFKRRTFDWQDGYGAFAIGISQIEATVRYIKNQERHHRRMTSAEEFERMLELHGIRVRD